MDTLTEKKNLFFKDYSKVEDELMHIFIKMHVANTMLSGNRWSIKEIKFEPDFSEKVQRMFEEKLEHVQYDAAKRILRTLWKDVTFTDTSV